MPLNPEIRMMLWRTHAISNDIRQSS